MSWRMVVAGDPVPKARPRFKGHAYTPDKTQAAERKIQWLARANKVRKASGPLVVQLSFYRATRRRCDLDNLAKLVLDSLNGLAWGDDSQIEQLHCSKAYDAADPRTVVTVQALEVSP